MPYYLYILRCGDNSLYTGITTDVARRLAAHQSGKGAKYTRGRGPLTLVYQEELPDKPSALRRELALLDVITLGKAQAINLGVDYDRTVRRLLLGVTLFIAIATAMVGPISFLGLIIANLSRQLFKTFRHSYLIAGSALIGMVILAGGQLITEQIFTYSVPVSVFITVGGGIYFLYLLLTKRRV